MITLFTINTIICMISWIVYFRKCKKRGQYLDIVDMGVTLYMITAITSFITVVIVNITLS